MWRRLYVPVLAAMLTASITAGMALGSGWHGGHEKGQQGYAIGLWGDLPYSDVQATAGVPNLITDIKASVPRADRHTPNSCDRVRPDQTRGAAHRAAPRSSSGPFGRRQP